MHLPYAPTGDPEFMPSTEGRNIMEANEIHGTIAQQLDNMRPDDLTPGTDVVMHPLHENTLLVQVMGNTPNDSRSHDVHITYDRGRDTYNVTIYRLGEKDELTDVYCDQLGTIVFGEHAKPFSLPLVRISDDDGESWTVIA